MMNGVDVGWGSKEGNKHLWAQVTARKVDKNGKRN
jgi:hypothetical protein